MYNAEKRKIVSGEFWRQTYVLRGQRSSGRQRRRWINVVKYNMKDLRVDLMDVEYRAKWRRRTRVADPSTEGSKPA